MPSPGSRAEPAWRRPVPVIGDPSAAHERALDPSGWAWPTSHQEALHDIIGSRRDIRRFRPDPLAPEIIRAVLNAGHAAPSVGHSQPWRFIVVTDPDLRDRAAVMADRARLAQAAHLTSERAGRLLDLKLEGLREAPVGIVVACDRRTPALGVLGRATFPDTDLWSCACAIENMWLTARGLGLGMGWVTLFQPAELQALLGLPDGVETLGWLCLGWPDERPPAPGLERQAWSSKLPLDEVVLENRWPADANAPAAPVSHLRAPDQTQVVAATDAADDLLSPPESLGVLDRALNRLVAIAADDVTGGTLVIVGADHPVAELGVSAYPSGTTRDVMSAAVAGASLGAVSARAAGLGLLVVDAGIDDGPLPGTRQARPERPRGNLRDTDAMEADDVRRLLDRGRELGAEAAGSGLVVLGEVGLGNTTVAAALACALLGLEPQDAVGLGAGSDSAMVARKTEVTAAALDRWRSARGDANDVVGTLAALGGPELTVLTGVVLGAAAAGAGVVLDGLAGSLPALLAVRSEPAVQAHLVAAQVSRERAHVLVLRELGLEPLLALRLRAGEGVGACLGAALLLQGLVIRRTAARTR